jgi:hypothetical protein
MPRQAGGWINDRVANNAMHTDSAMTLRLHIEDHLRGAGDGER